MTGRDAITKQTRSYGELVQLARTPALLDRLTRIIMENKHIGNLTELQCMTRFYELGYSVSIPYGDSEKYDMILDCNKKLYKLQCKHAKEFFTEDGTLSYLKIKTSWQSGYTKNSPYKHNKYSEEDVDYFVTHYQDKNYLIPVNECSTEKILRILPPKNGQTKGISFLVNYVDEEVIKTL